MSYTDPCLGPTGVGVLDSKGELTPQARNSFTSQVVLLLTSGNANGKGAKISTLLGVPFPPPAGIKVPDPDRLLTHPNDLLGDLFWFDPSPFAPLTFPALADPKGGYQTQIVTLLYGSLMKAMNLNGNAAAPPVLDFTGFLPPDLALKLTLPDLPKIAIALPGGLPTLKALNLDLGDIPTFIANLAAVVPTPSLPSIPTPPIPAFDFVVFPKLFLELLELPFKLLPDLVVKLLANVPGLLAPSPPDLFNLVLGLFFGPLLDILKALGLLTILPKLLVATFIVILQNAVCALVPLAVSQVIGTGLVVKTIGQALGLA